MYPFVFYIDLVLTYFSMLQTIFIISVCNNQLLDWVENELIWVLSHIPGVASVLPTLIAKLHAAKDKYLVTAPPVASKVQVDRIFLLICLMFPCMIDES